MAEIVGGLAIVVSLIFVGFQINEGNREARAATTQSVLDAEMFFQSVLLENADVWETVIVGGDLSDNIEVRRAIVLFNMLLTQDENQYLQQLTGYFEESTTLDLARIGRMASPAFLRLWRDSPGALARGAEYLRMVDAALGLGTPD